MSYPYGGSGPGYPPSGGGGYPPAVPGVGYPPPVGQMPQPAPAGLPYAPQPYGPTSGGMNYPSPSVYPPGPGSMPPPGPGYPPSVGGMPTPGGGMPTPGGGMPTPGGGMPTPDSSTYPPTLSSGYPPSSAPYNQTGTAPYPTSQGTSAIYPTAGGAMPSQPAGYSQNAAGAASQSSGSGRMPSAPSAPSAPPARPTAGPSGNISDQLTSTHISDPNLSSYYVNAQKKADSGTILPLKQGFNAEADATQIRNTFKNMSVNETVFVSILPHRSNAQRQQIRQMYKTAFGKDLLQDCRAKMSGDFESVCAGLIMTPAEYDAYQINKAVSGMGTDEDALVEILCTRTNAQIKELSRVYQEMYKCTIEQDLKGDSSGHFKRMLVSLSNGARLEDQGVNTQKSEDDAKRLYKAGAARLGTDESTFNAILVSQSFEQLKAVFSSYERLYKKDMEKVIKSEMSGDLEKGMKTIVRFTTNKHLYFANQLYKAMKGLGTDEKTLVRILVSRSEIDLEQVKQAFNTIKGESKSLSHWLKKETSGPFREILMHVIGEGH